MDRTIKDLNSDKGAGSAPQNMPEDVRLTLLATVTERIIKIRHQTPSVVSTYELGRLIPAAEWLTGEAEGGSGAKH